MRIAAGFSILIAQCASCSLLAVFLVALFGGMNWQSTHTTMPNDMQRTRSLFTFGDSLCDRGTFGFLFTFNQVRPDGDIATGSDAPSTLFSHISKRITGKKGCPALGQDGSQCDSYCNGESGIYLPTERVNLKAQIREWRKRSGGCSNGDFVFISAGGNDVQIILQTILQKPLDLEITLNEIKTEFEHVLRDLIEHGCTEIVAVSVPDFSQTARFQRQPELLPVIGKVVALVNNAIFEAVQQFPRQVQFYDFDLPKLFPKFEEAGLTNTYGCFPEEDRFPSLPDDWRMCVEALNTNNSVFSDGFHGSSLAYDIIGKDIEKSIRRHARAE